MTGEWRLSEEIWPITVFVTAFSLGIAWFKDIPDTQGDDQYQFGTLAVLSGRRFAFRAGLLVVSLAYLSVMLAAILGQLPVPWFYILTQAFFLMAFLNRARRLDLQDNVQVKGFYMFFWGLFFLEYLIYPVGFFV